MKAGRSARQDESIANPEESDERGQRGQRPCPRGKGHSHRWHVYTGSACPEKPPQQPQYVLPCLAFLSHGPLGSRLSAKGGFIKLEEARFRRRAGSGRNPGRKKTSDFTLGAWITCARSSRAEVSVPVCGSLFSQRQQAHSDNFRPTCEKVANQAGHHQGSQRKQARRDSGTGRPPDAPLFRRIRHSLMVREGTGHRNSAGREADRVPKRGKIAKFGIWT